jgi:hypothetical protein
MEPAAKKAGPLDSFTVKPAQADQVHRMLAIHVIKKERPFEDVECPSLRQAFAIVGVKLKGEKAFRTTYLSRLFVECRADVQKQMKKLLVGVVCACTRAATCAYACTLTHVL